ncbi:MAG: dTDP-4-dehydrorhamnose reductase [Clostridia bacterium]|nr:dTDP-4-dehydrorhamnose reductase [Lachnospiraceae bacterium]NCC01647.1 dTDP-4-dehydrorhamnose reductase [Clostridia bacterium]NCD03567.1 dTDP-4-dehydrorhamnose reductase [Clostridia bacterium]
MKVFVTGIKGQLGHDVVNELIKRNHEAVGVDIEEMDITDKMAVDQTIKAAAPDAVIHCAAWTAVDAAEEDSNRDKVYAVNVTGTQHIAQICKALDIPMMYISTDYVFDGQGTEPWTPDCRNYNPLNVYGLTKFEGELAVASLLSKFFIVRIAWVFGTNGNNFIKTMLNIGKNHDKLTVVNDQIGTPTYTYDLARLLVDMIETDKYGYYHATNEGGYISWYDFAKEIFRQAEALGNSAYDSEHLTVAPVTTAEYGVSKAARPFNSRLDKSKLIENGFAPLPTWQDALNRYLKEIIE